MKPSSNEKINWGLAIAACLLIVAFTVQSYRLMQAEPRIGSIWISCNQYVLEKLNRTDCHGTFSMQNGTLTMNGTYEINMYGLKP